MIGHGRLQPVGSALLVAMLSLVCSVPGAQAAASSPVVVDLGPYTAGADPGLSVNRYGQIAGTATRQFYPRAAVWTPAAQRVERRLLPIPARWAASYAADINDHGVVVGSVADFNFSERAAVWRADGIHILSYQHGAAEAVNNNGDIAGEIIIRGHAHAVIWHANGSLTDLAARLGGIDSYAHAINGHGAVAGFIKDDPRHYSAFLVDANQVTILPPVQHANLVDAYGLNSNDEVVGYWACFVAGCDPDAGLFGRAFLYRDGHSRSLPQLTQGSAAIAFARLDSGVTVGTDDVHPLSATGSYAVEWRDGVETKLDQLVTSPLFTRFTAAEDVNASGVIVGQGDVSADGTIHGFAMYPGGQP